MAKLLTIKTLIMLSPKTKSIIAFLCFVIFAIVGGLLLNSFAPAIPAVSMALIPLVNLDAPASGGSLSGIHQIVYIIYKDDILTFPTKSATPATPEDTVTLIGDFVLKPGKFWRTFYSTQEEGELKSEATGNKDMLYFLNSGSFVYPKNTALSLGLANTLINKDLIILVKEFDCSGANSGIVKVIGSEVLPAQVKVSVNSGKKFSDMKGITFNFESTSCSLPPIYTGEILTEAGSINTPTQLTLNATSINGALGGRFVPNASQTADITITTYTNCPVGHSIRVENNKDLSLTLDLANGGTIILTEGKYADLYFYKENEPIVTNNN